MAALHPTTTFNIEATITQWVITKFATMTLPLTLNYSFETLQPNTPLVTPSFSITHRPAGRDMAYQGNMAIDARNIMQISGWLSRTGNPNWLAQQRVMTAMIEALFASPAVVRVQNYLSTPATPSTVDYKVNMAACEFLALPHDPNPDIERVSANIVYEWHLRTNVT